MGTRRNDFLCRCCGFEEKTKLCFHVMNKICAAFSIGRLVGLKANPQNHTYMNERPHMFMK